MQKLVEAKKLHITMAKDKNEVREKPYKVFYFSSNLDHILFGKANNESYNKVNDAKAFSNDFYDQPLKLARYFLDHPSACGADNYKESWEMIFDETETLKPKTNIDCLIKELLKKANIKIEDLPENDIR